MAFEEYLKEDVDHLQPRFDTILYDFAEVKDIQKLLRYLREAYNRGYVDGYTDRQEREFDL